MKVQKDKIFILVMAIVVAGLAYQLILRAIDLSTNIKDLRDWLLLLVNGFAIYYSLVLLNNNRKRNRIVRDATNNNKKD